MDSEELKQELVRLGYRARLVSTKGELLCGTHLEPTSPNLPVDHPNQICLIGNPFVVKPQEEGWVVHEPFGNVGKSVTFANTEELFKWLRIEKPIQKALVAHERIELSTSSL